MCIQVPCVYLLSAASTVIANNIHQSTSLALSCGRLAMVLLNFHSSTYSWHNFFCNLKGLSHQIKFALKWYDSLGVGKDMWRWTLKNFFTLPLILYSLLKFLYDPHKTLINLLFLRKSASVATCRLRIFTLLLPIVAGVALDVLGNRKVQLFRYTYQHWRISPLSLGMR